MINLNNIVPISQLDGYTSVMITWPKLGKYCVQSRQLQEVTHSLSFSRACWKLCAELQFFTFPVTDLHIQLPLKARSLMPYLFIFGLFCLKWNVLWTIQAFFIGLKICQVLGVSQISFCSMLIQKNMKIYFFLISRNDSLANPYKTFL